ncbi:putative leucine-rich repeat receptor-like serine/threonine-protein kinase At2g19230 [Medicago truncatula]|uniref:putative leucine-rich repeat receptor-like serine/threonine-protein kinase At2g19230 n=1 Tax=Medicago truncatula TaxID=3880 RepID=UPI001967A644|nr:putative leucine-rich repeat receptor-like serine/threonine-protein kinase At2g19230 [Medicago truncatula]
MASYSFDSGANNNENVTEFSFSIAWCSYYLVLIQAQDQSGFISIDCGLPENSNYTEKITGINYISDAEFIDTGVSKSISPAEMITHQQQLHFVRSFPSGVRNCYRINVNMGVQYLIRATFLYGNYDNINEPPQFDLHFGPNVWDTVLLSNASRPTIKEIIYIPSKDYIQPCLVKTGKGTPFISTIELRTLGNDSYIGDSKKPVILSHFMRYDLGSITNLEYRYKDDVYDRIWSPYESSDWRRLSTSLNNNALAQNSYKPPAIVMTTAATPVNASAPLQFHWYADSVNDQYYLYLYFNEVEKLAGNKTRAFNITLNDEFWYEPVVPAVIYTTTHMTGAKRYQFSLIKTENSTLPPILNAYEVYKVKQFLQPETQQDDVDTITNIKKTYGVAKNWQGDPCGPVKYIWEGLNCSVDGYNPQESHLYDNPDLCMTAPCRKKNLTVPLIASFSALIVILLISLGFWIFRRQKVTSSNSKKRGSMISKHERFSYTEILNITDNFKTILGEGGFGKVYFGILQDQTQVAVKRLSLSSMQGYKEFQSEVSHSLVYEYMANGNLQQHLQGNSETSNILKWNERLNIAVDAANGLDYLHNGCQPPIMHRDLKPSNILLDDNMHAKIADFGLSRAFDNDIDSQILTRPAGTLGYADPEYQRTGNTNKKNDIYSFGIILFVLITGRQAIVRAAGENIHILEWVIPIVEGGDIQKVVDPKLEGKFSINSSRKFLEIAKSCISPTLAERPDISQILAELKECLSLEMVQRHEESENDVIEMSSSSFQSVTAPFPR